MVVSYLSQHPFFLISVAGGCIGVGASCVVRWRQRRLRPVLFRRRCRIVVPAVLTVAVAAIGAAFVTDAAPLFIDRWRFGALVGAGFSGAVLIVIATPRWWRVLASAPFIVVVGVPLVLWNPLPQQEFSPLRRFVPIVVPQDGVQPPGGIPLALLRVRQTPDSRSLEIAMLSTTPLLSASAGASGGRPSTMTIPPEATVQISVETVQTPPALWWFIPSGLPFALTIDAERAADLSVEDPEPELRRYTPGTLPDWLFTRLARVDIISTTQMDVRVPPEGEGFLQPGLYLIGLTPDGLIVPEELADSQ